VTPGAVYLGVGVGAYDNAAYPPLPRATLDASDLAEILAGFGYEAQLVADPDRVAAVQLDQVLAKDLLGRGGLLIVLWSGHGELASEQDKLVLVVKDTEPGSAPLITADLLAGIAARTGANQVLLVLDTCYSGAGTINAAAVADRVLQELPPAAERVWFGVLASAMDAERARDGLFGEQLRRLLKDGPQDPELRLRWSAHSIGVRGDDVIDALLKEWGSDVQQPKYAATGNAWVMLPNPRHDPGAAARVVEHLLLAARGIDPGEGGFYFTGRTQQLNHVVGWLQAGQPGVFVVTGPAGSGKSAIVGRVVSLSDPDERARLLAQGSLGHADLGERSVAAHVHARRLTAERLVETIDEQLVAAAILPPHLAGRRNRGQLQGDLEQSGSFPAIAIDGLEEAGTEAWRIAEDVIRLLAGTARVLVGTRDVPAPSDERSLVETLAPSETIDLGNEELQPDTVADVRAYVAKRLAGIGEPEMDAAKIGDAIVRLAQEQGEGLFLLARVVTAQLRREPINTSLPGWESQLAHSVKDAFAHDLDRIPPLRKDDRDMPQAARELLSALAWGYGAGLPDDVWPIIATALSPTTLRYDRNDVFWVLGQAGRYIVEDGEGGRAVYRLSHQRLADYLRLETPATPDATSTDSVVLEERATRVAIAVVDYYEQLLGAGLSPTEPAYLWLYSWRHCADAGQPGITALRRLVHSDKDAFLPDLAMALSNLGNRYSEVGRRQEAVAPTEEAVALRRDLAAANPAYQPDLVAALNNLGNRYSEVGRRQEAVAPTEEAVALYRDLAAANPAYQPDLAMALSNLGNRYSEVGRHQEAVAPTEEAVALYREQAAANPAYQPNLAGTLSNLGNRYSEVGRRQEAVAPTEEAVALRREQAAANPAYQPNLAGTLSNLGIRYSEVGRHQEAVAPTEEAVALYREQAAANPAYQPNLAMALNNLGNRYSEVGRRQEAVAPTEEAVALRREQAAANPAYQPDLAGTLSSLGNRYSEVGRHQEAVAPTEEAVRLYRDLAAANPAYQPNLAMALSNLGNTYSEVGRHQEAVAPTEEAVALYRDLAAANPAYQPNLAMALSNLGIRYSEVGRHQEAVAPTEEAVRLYRDLAAANPAFLPNLAMALTNLGSRYSKAEQDDAIERMWHEAISSLTDSSGKAFLLVRRAEGRAATDHSAVDDLLAAQALLTDSDGDLTADLHSACRTRRAQDPEAFDSRWPHESGALPGWLLISEDDLEIVWQWLTTSPEATAKQLLVQHADRLLAPTSDVALDEIALRLPDRSAIEPYRQLLGEARRVGIEDAYRSWLALELLENWLDAPLEEKRSMLDDQRTRGELLGPDVADALGGLRESDPNDSGLIVHEALLSLAREGRDGAAFEALAEPTRFPALLSDLARSNEFVALDALATLATMVDAGDAEQASGWLHKAIALAVAGDPDAALDAARRARRLDPGQVAAWLGLLVELAPHHPSIVSLSQTLAETPRPSAP